MSIDPVEQLEALGLVSVEGERDPLTDYEQALASGGPVPVDVALAALNAGYDITAIEGHQQLEFDFE